MLRPRAYGSVRGAATWPPLRHGPDQIQGASGRVPGSMPLRETGREHVPNQPRSREMLHSRQASWDLAGRPRLFLGWQPEKAIGACELGLVHSAAHLRGLRNVDRLASREPATRERNTAAGQTPMQAQANSHPRPPEPLSRWRYRKRERARKREVRGPTAWPRGPRDAGRHKTPRDFFRSWWRRV